MLVREGTTESARCSAVYNSPSTALSEGVDVCSPAATPALTRLRESDTSQARVRVVEQNGKWRREIAISAVHRRRRFEEILDMLGPKFARYLLIKSHVDLEMGE